MPHIATDRRRLLEVVVLVAVGGFAGANLRHVLAAVGPGLAGTFAANALGCFALGVLAAEADLVGALPEELWFFAATGFLSSLTTYSTFALEAVRAAPALAVAYVAGTYAVGFAAVLAGRTVARRVAEVAA